VITLTQNGYTLGFALGGARASSVASGGDAVGDLFDVGSGVAGDVTDVALPDGLGVGDLGGLGGVDGLSSGETRDSGAGPTISLTPTTAAAATGRPLSAAAIVLAVLGALLVGAGLRRLNTAVLAEPAVICTLPGADQ
jgi:hypothetical protein